MMDVTHLLALNATWLAVVFVGLWLISLALRDVSFIDSWWAFGLGGLGLAAFLETPAYGPRQRVLVTLAVVWALRLGVYIFWRWRSHGPDLRYKRIIAHAERARGWNFATTAGVQVFLLQGILQFIASLSVQFGQWDGDGKIGAFTIIGAAVALFGLLFETIGDAQLTRFKANPANKGKVLDSGLWHYTRHPNYFGEAVFWWGIFLIAAQTKLGLWALPSPILVTFLLTRVSGVPMLEDAMKRKPDHAAYAARTSAFIPWPPKST